MNYPDLIRAAGRAGLCIALAGCATPTVPPPEDRPTPLEFRYGTAPAPGLPGLLRPEEKEAAPPAAGTPWWSAFRNAELDRLLRRVADDNPDYAAALKRLDEARLQARLPRSRRLPLVEYGFNAERSRFSGAGSGFNSGRTRNSFELPLTFRYEPDIWQRVRRALEAGEAEAGAVAAESENLLLLLQTELAARFFDWQAIHTEDAVLEQAVSIREQALKLTRARFTAGDVSEIDVALAETELAQVRTERIGLNRLRVEVENAVAAGVGSYPSEFKLPAQNLSPGGPALKGGLPSELLRRRPDVRAAEKRLEAELARLGGARSLRYPSVILSGSAGFESETPGDLGGSDSLTWRGGFALSGPLFDAGTTRILEAIADARVRRAEAAYRAVLVEAFRQSETALGVIAALDEQIAGYRDTVESARRTVALTEKQYTAGFVDYFEVVNAQRTLLVNEQAAARALAERYRVLVQLVRALGGGWE